MSAKRKREDQEKKREEQERKRNQEKSKEGTPRRGRRVKASTAERVNFDFSSRSLNSMLVSGQGGRVVEEESRGRGGGAAESGGGGQVEETHLGRGGNSGLDFGCFGVG